MFTHFAEGRRLHLSFFPLSASTFIDFSGGSPCVLKSEGGEERERASQRLFSTLSSVTLWEEGGSGIILDTTVLQTDSESAVPSVFPVSKRKIGFCDWGKIG